MLHLQELKLVVMVRMLFLLLLLSITACSSNKTTSWFQNSYDDDLYYVSSGEADRTVAVKTTKPDAAVDPYEEYLQARRGRNSGVSPYDYEATQYDRTMQRHADPFWSSPSMGFGLGGFWGSRSYMLYNPFFPPFFSMQPGLSLGFGMGNGFYPGMGFGMHPWQMGGWHDPWMMSSGFGWGNPWMMQGWNSPWGWGGGGWYPGNQWGNGWNNNWGGNWGGDVSGSVQQAPPRNGRAMGGALPSQPDLFNPSGGRRQGNTPGQSVPSNVDRNAYNPESDRATRQARPYNPNATPTREQGDRTTRRVVTERRPTSTPSRGEFERPNRSTPSWTPERSSGRDNASPSRSGSSDRGSWSPSPSRSADPPPSRSGGSGGGGTRPSGGGNPGRPR